MSISRRFSDVRGQDMIRSIPLLVLTFVSLAPAPSQLLFHSAEEIGPGSDVINALLKKTVEIALIENVRITLDEIPIQIH
jgi:hypothetical protein